MCPTLGGDEVVKFLHLKWRFKYLGKNSFPFVVFFSCVYYYYTTSLNKVLTQVLRRFKACSEHVRDLGWWVSLTMALVGSKAKNLWSVNHTTKAIQHHHHQSALTPRSFSCPEKFFVARLMWISDHARRDFKSFTRNCKSTKK